MTSILAIAANLLILQANRSELIHLSHINRRGQFPAETRAKLHDALQLNADATRMAGTLLCQFDAANDAQPAGPAFA